LVHNLKKEEFQQLSDYKIQNDLIKELKGLGYDGYRTKNEIAIWEEDKSIKKSYSYNSLRQGDFAYKKHLINSLDRKRETMPQVKQKNLDDILIHFAQKSPDTKVSKEKVKSSDIRFVQGEIDEEKVLRILGEMPKEPRTYLLSKDKTGIYLLDGNHNFCAECELSDEFDINAYIIHLPVNEAIRRLNLMKVTKNSPIRKSEDELGKGCLMLQLPFDNWNEIISKVDKNDLYDEEGFGLEDEPHLTVLYGFTPHQNIEKIKKTVSSFKDLSVRIDNVSVFQNDNYDVLKFGIAKDHDLMLLRNEIEDNFEYESTFPDYNPHCTIAYLKPNTAKKYIDIFEEYVGSHIKSTEFKYSYYNTSDKMEAVFFNTKTQYAASIVRNEEGKILFLRRHPNDDFHPNTLCLPSGGIEPNEEPKEAAIRELKEETFLDANEVYVSTKIINDTSCIYYHEVSVKDGEIVLDKEHSNYEWLSMNDLKDDPEKQSELILDLYEHLCDIFYMNEANDAYRTIQKAFNEDLITPEQYIQAKQQFDLVKSRSGKYADTAQNRQLKRVGQEYGSKGQQDDSKSNDKATQSYSKDTKSYSDSELREHAKNAPQADLERQIKESDDPKIRKQAHEELDRRSKEESVQEEKHEESKEKVKSESPDNHDLKSALLKYQGTSFDNINTSLRYDGGKGLSESDKETVKVLDKASTDKTTDNLFRGLDSNFIKDIAQKFKISDWGDIDDVKSKVIGKEIKDKSFSSTSKSIDVAKDFARNKGAGMGIIMKIEGDKTGIDLANNLNNSKSKKEKEFLIKRGSNFKVERLGRDTDTGALVLIGKYTQGDKERVEAKKSELEEKDDSKFMDLSSKDSESNNKKSSIELYESLIKNDLKLKRLNINLDSIDKDGNYTLYHGTNDKSAESILSEGLKSPNNDAKWFMTTTDKNVATRFAEGVDGNRLLEIKIPLTMLKDFLWGGEKTSVYQNKTEDTQHAIKSKINPEFIKDSKPKTKP
jgi:8-oxo-dGTP diphosphatase